MRNFCQLLYFVFTRAQFTLGSFKDSHFGVTSILELYEGILQTNASSDYVICRLLHLLC